MSKKINLPQEIADELKNFALEQLPTEIKKAKELFAYKQPNTAGYKYENLRAQADLEFAMKFDSAKKNKIQLLTALSLLGSQEMTSVETASEDPYLVKIIEMAERRVNDKK